MQEKKRRSIERAETHAELARLEIPEAIAHIIIAYCDLHEKTVENTQAAVAANANDSENDARAVL